MANYDQLKRAINSDKALAASLLASLYGKQLYSVLKNRTGSSSAAKKALKNLIFNVLSDSQTLKSETDFEYVVNSQISLLAPHNDESFRFSLEQNSDIKPAINRWKQVASLVFFGCAVALLIWAILNYLLFW